MNDETEPLALVVGGGSGIGAALADRLRAQGTTTVTWDIAGAHDVTCDVTEPAAIDEAVRLTRARWGVPTWVTVTAGVGHAGLLADASVGGLRPDHACERARALAVHAGLGRRHAASEAVAGSFVAVSSVSAQLVDRNMGVYCASKAALSMLVKVAAVEWGPLGLRVNAVAPGVTRTPMLGRGPAGHRRGLAVAGRRGRPHRAGPAGRGRRHRAGHRRAARHGVGHRPGPRVPTAGSRCTARSTPSATMLRAQTADR